MYPAISTPAKKPVKQLHTGRESVTAIKKKAAGVTRADQTAFARHIRSALTVDQLVLEEDFYVFDYGNAM